MGGTESTPVPQPPPNLYAKPWRTSASTYQQLVEEITNINPGCVANILLVGPSNAGKSSTINSIFSISKGRLVNEAFAGEKKTSFTKDYDCFSVDEGVLQQCCLWDSMGIEKAEENGIMIDDLESSLKGHIKKGYSFNPRSKIKENDPCFREDPGFEDQIHGVALVCDSSCVDPDVLRPYRQKLTELLEKIISLKIPYICILTKIDEICPEVNGDVRKTFHSIKVSKAVKTASKVFGIPEAHIHPVKNVGKEIEINEFAGFYILIALRQLMQFAQDRIAKLQKERE